MSRKLKDWVRLDASGVPVIGSNIRRPKRPTSGKWQLIDVTGCCGPELTVTASAFPNDAPVLEISCDGSARISVPLDDINVEFTNIHEAVEYLNRKLNYLGNFYIESDVIKLKLKESIANTICGSHSDIEAELSNGDE